MPRAAAPSVWALARTSDRLRRAGAAALALLLAGAATAQVPAPRRVVSINLCTDQLALMLAAPGQLVSVTAFAQDPRQSPLAAEASALPANHARAEEVYLLRPDLVLASDFTAPATLAMLRRLGLRVETFPAAQSLADVDAAIGQMGAALGREDAAAAMQARFRAELAALRGASPAATQPAADPGTSGAVAAAEPPAPPGAEAHPAPRAAIFEANGYTPSPRSLAGEIVAAAGFRDVAAEAGLDYGGMIPLEQLVMLSPDAVISPRPPVGTSRGDELAAHPAVRHLRARGIAVPRMDSDWTCATPRVLEAVRRLAEARRAAVRGAAP